MMFITELLYILTSVSLLEENFLGDIHKINGFNATQHAPPCTLNCQVEQTLFFLLVTAYCLLRPLYKIASKNENETYFSIFQRWEIHFRLETRKEDRDNQNKGM